MSTEIKDKKQSIKPETIFYILTHSSLTPLFFIFLGLVIGDLVNITKIKNDYINVLAGILIVIAIIQVISFFVNKIRGKEIIRATNQKITTITSVVLFTIHIVLMLVFQL